MCHKRRWIDRHGQLALVDAVVFFTAMLLVSGILVAFCRTDSQAYSPVNNGSRNDPATVLQVFLKTSLGASVGLLHPTPVTLESRSEAAECLAVEVHAIGHGIPVSSFKPLNDLLLGVLETVCGPSQLPCLEVLRLADAQPEVVLRLGVEASEASSIRASSVELPGTGGADYFVTLELAPAFLPEQIDV